MAHVQTHSLLTTKQSEYFPKTDYGHLTKFTQISSVLLLGRGNLRTRNSKIRAINVLTKKEVGILPNPEDLCQISNKIPPDKNETPICIWLSQIRAHSIKFCAGSKLWNDVEISDVHILLLRIFYILEEDEPGI